MNKTENAQVSMLALVALFFTKYLTKLKTYKPLSDTITEFFIIYGNVKINLQRKDAGTAGVKDNKDTLKQKMIDLVFPLARLGHGWATTNTDEVLKALFNVTESSFRGVEEEAVLLANNIIGALSLKLDKLVTYEITQELLDAATAAILLFNNAIGTPEQAKVYP